MSGYILLIALALISQMSNTLKPNLHPIITNFFNIKINDIWGNPYNLESLKNKKLTMFVNVAS